MLLRPLCLTPKIHGSCSPLSPTTSKPSAWHFSGPYYRLSTVWALSVGHKVTMTWAHCTLPTSHSRNNCLYYFTCAVAHSVPSFAHTIPSAGSLFPPSFTWLTLTYRPSLNLGIMACRKPILNTRVGPTALQHIPLPYLLHWNLYLYLSP